jgi:hydrogenase large subunit
MATLTIDPTNRLEGHQKWEINASTFSGTGLLVDDAHISGQMFRGFERILEGRDPRDAIIICGRI